MKRRQFIASLGRPRYRSIQLPFLIKKCHVFIEKTEAIEGFGYGALIRRSG